MIMCYKRCYNQNWEYEEITIWEIQLRNMVSNTGLKNILKMLKMEYFKDWKINYLVWQWRGCTWFCRFKISLSLEQWWNAEWCREMHLIWLNSTFPVKAGRRAYYLEILSVLCNLKLWASRQIIPTVDNEMR